MVQGWDRHSVKCGVETAPEMLPYIFLIGSTEEVEGGNKFQAGLRLAPLVHEPAWRGAGECLLPWHCPVSWRALLRHRTLLTLLLLVTESATEGGHRLFSWPPNIGSNYCGKPETRVEWTPKTELGASALHSEMFMKEWPQLPFFYFFAGTEG